MLGDRSGDYLTERATRKQDALAQGTLGVGVPVPFPNTLRHPVHYSRTRRTPKAENKVAATDGPRVPAEQGAQRPLRQLTGVSRSLRSTNQTSCAWIFVFFTFPPYFYSIISFLFVEILKLELLDVTLTVPLVLPIQSSPRCHSLCPKYPWARFDALTTRYPRTCNQTAPRGQ
ncbi:hypothetical protein F5884DRAFT_363159 [Xylogone sp. PMI_703]|nr:hypothetical protein F5884DRAFT_363159 [Xylogone sp. PMI_703]